MAQTIIQGWFSWNASDFDSLADAVTELAANSAQLVIDTLCEVDTDLTIPDNIAIAPTPQGSIKPANGVFVVIERMAFVPGPFQWIDESGGGRVVVCGLTRGDRRWRGATSDQPACPFTWAGSHPLPEVYFIDGEGRAVIDPDYDVANFAPARTVEVWVDPDGGDDGDPGTEAQPLKTLNAALAVSNVDTIYLKAGIHREMNWALIPSRDISFICYGGERAYIIESRKHTWTLSAGTSNVYESNQNGAPSAVWLDTASVNDDGDYYELVQVEDVSECDNTPGSYYFDDPGNKLYVHTFDSRPADDDIWVILQAASHSTPVNQAITLYFENITVIGGNTALMIRKDNVLVGKGLHVKYSTGADGMEVIGGAEVYLQDCVFARNETDGMSYRPSTTVPSVLEINCEARYNGQRRPTNESAHNGSTGHQGVSIVRINGDYHHNRGPNVVDVGGATSWNVGCYSYDSIKQLAGSAFQASNFFVQDGEMWIEGGRSVCRPNSPDAELGASRVDVVAHRGYAYLRDLQHTGRIDSTALADPPHVVGTF